MVCFDYDMISLLVGLSAPASDMCSACSGSVVWMEYVVVCARIYAEV
jgi:hypothetical protein